jgi:hypothetical protein
MEGSVVHEYAHGNSFSKSDADFQTALGITVQKDTSNISKKLTTDCFTKPQSRLLPGEPQQ